MVPLRAWSPLCGSSIANGGPLWLVFYHSVFLNPWSTLRLSPRFAFSFLPFLKLAHLFISYPYKPLEVFLFKEVRETIWKTVAMYIMGTLLARSMEEKIKKERSQARRQARNKNKDIERNETMT